MGSEVNKKKRERRKERRKRKEKEKRKKKKRKKKEGGSLDEWILSKLGRQKDRFSLQSILRKTLRSFAS